MSNLDLWKEYIPIISTMIVAMTAVMVGLYSLIYSKRQYELSRYDHDVRKAVMSEARYAYEKQLADLNMQLTATQARWADANHLLIESQKKQDRFEKNSNATYSNFLRSMNIENGDLEIDQKLVFVLTPFDQAQNEVFQIIKDVCIKYGFRVIRGDEEFSSGNILAQIVRNIVRARLVIANISTRNANVFFELGIAQALDKQTLLVSQTIGDLPFDVQNQRIVLFNDIADLPRKLQDALFRTLVNVDVADRYKLKD